MQAITDDLSQAAYIGDDLNNFLCMKLVKEAGGLTGCPKNAAKQVTQYVNYVADHNGGDGAVRDFIEWLME